VTLDAGTTLTPSTVRGNPDTDEFTDLRRSDRHSLALVAADPDLVLTLVAHEPPLAAFVSDREAVLAANRDIGETYQRSGTGPAMAKFLQLVMVEGPLPASYGDQPDPDPAMFGLPTDDDGSRDDPLLGQNIRTCVPYEPDLGRLRSA
jgi:hypothetical protein